MIAAMLSTKDTSGFLRPFQGLVSELLAVSMAASTAGRRPPKSWSWRARRG